ncbi:uncharacterized protein AB675_7170 [Cyphellophora attinorum]|uniref:Uncharacterized protein n=1 Tax=Cyphellophora attinorum TaxID=1664694 RepID=A0A0N1H8J6_9EURO|nr:uncharacterized protein AB675_7170 [Phialophora attinorum]KPI43364.1 hypothetical protein AB675_7170 [Phialophora attinorum]
MTPADTGGAAHRVLKRVVDKSSRVQDVVNDVDLDALAAEIISRTTVNSLPEIPAKLLPIQQQYLEAVRTNKQARLKYDQAAADAKACGRHVKLEADSTPKPSLFDHLNLLRQQRLTKSLAVLQRYMGEVETLSIDATAFDPLAVTAENDIDTSLSLAQTESSVLQKQLKDCTRKLEIAVIEADNQAKSSKVHLDAAQAPDTGPARTDSVSQLRGLTAVRDELTTWLEESLAACVSLPNEIFDTGPQVDEITTEDVQSEYSSYIVARQDLINSMASLSHQQSQPTVNAHSVSGSEALANDLRTTTPEDTAYDDEHAYFHHQSLTSIGQANIHAQQSLQSEQSATLEVLRRLADESQLLPQYPILSKSNRFGRLATQLGTRAIREADDEVTDQIHIWAFAIDAARQTTEGAVAAQMKEAEAALNEAEEVLEQLKLLQNG